jgi:hypothetical protein
MLPVRFGKTSALFTKAERFGRSLVLALTEKRLS